MKQKLSDLASIAEIIASVAVVATLIVLIFGVRENTEVVRASAYASNVENINNLQIGMLNDPDAVRVWTDFMSGEAADLDRIDTMRLNLMLLTLFRSYESAYFNRSYGVLGEEESNRFDRSICEFFALARSADRTRPLRNTLTEGFFAYMIELCSD